MRPTIGAWWPMNGLNDIKIKTKGNEGRWSEMKVNEGR